MKTRHLFLILALGFALPACRSGVDLEAERASLRQTDQAFAAAAAEGKDVDRIMSFCVDDAKIYPPGMAPVEGKAAIREFVAGSLAVPGFVVTWQPREVVVSPDGQFGYTTGANQITAPDPQGNAVTTSGRYVTIWRKETDGSWKCVVDIWNAGA